MEVTREMVEAAFRDDRPATTIVLASHWLQATPDDFFTVLNYAEMLFRTNRYEEALRVYESALTRFDDRHWAIFNQIGRLYDHWGRASDAEPWFQKAIELDPEEWPSYTLLGECQERQGKLKEAEATYRAWLKREECWLTYYRLGLVLRNQRRLDDAAECLRKSLAINPAKKVVSDALEDVVQAMAFAEAGLT